jgi:hypothetical protein
MHGLLMLQVGHSFIYVSGNIFYLHYCRLSSSNHTLPTEQTAQSPALLFTVLLTVVAFIALALGFAG